MTTHIEAKAPRGYEYVHLRCPGFEMELDVMGSPTCNERLVKALLEYGLPQGKGLTLEGLKKTTRLVLFSDMMGDRIVEYEQRQDDNLTVEMA